MICQAPCQLLMGPKVVYRAAHPVVPISFICSTASCCTSSPAEKPILKGTHSPRTGQWKPDPGVLLLGPVGCFGSFPQPQLVGNVPGILIHNGLMGVWEDHQLVGSGSPALLGLEVLTDILPWQTNKIFFILLSQHLAQCQNSVADALRARAQRCAVLYPLQILADGSTALFLKVLQ